MRGIIGIGLAVVILFSSGQPARATPGHGVSAKVVGQWTVDDTDYVLREITIRPGGSTGWHRHPGLVLASVQRGTLTHRMSDCVTVRRYAVGESLMEDPDDGRAHLGENRGSKPVVLDAVYATPQGRPLAVDSPAPAC
ncbi:cupin domain-containing protein [Actinoplanes sp. DH11]|uniref:cupin domain-containing protein n=1 Tax=Actinoplanes sp. DH11 TaxID=2857011 RepID=UPI001E39BE4F|nr:cupin domain-containing protein [Actinoplanes sp. DH11]